MGAQVVGLVSFSDWCSFFLLVSERIMAKQRLLAVIILALVLAVTFNSGSDFVGARNPASKSTTGRMAALGKDSQGRYRFLVDGAVPEPPPPPKGSSFGETMIGASIVLTVCFQLCKLM